MQLVASVSTVLKQSTDPSESLDRGQKVNFSEGSEFDIDSYEEVDGQHIKVTFSNDILGEEGSKTWYAFKPHITLLGNEPDNQPKDEPDANLIEISKKKEGPFNLPGHESTFYLSEPILEGGNFSWAEATKNGSRIPVNKSIVEGILKIAEAMEEIREKFDDVPIIINSWYRDPLTNRRVGGASRSRHLSGDAVDFVVTGIPPHEVNRVMEEWWGSRGGLASASSFTHADLRGYRARWRYGF